MRACKYLRIICMRICNYAWIIYMSKCTYAWIMYMSVCKHVWITYMSICKYVSWRSRGPRIAQCSLRRSVSPRTARSLYIYVYVSMYECTSAYVSKFVYIYMSRYEYMNVKECM